MRAGTRICVFNAPGESAGGGLGGRRRDVGIVSGDQHRRAQGRVADGTHSAGTASRVAGVFREVLAPRERRSEPARGSRVGERRQPRVRQVVSVARHAEDRCFTGTSGRRCVCARAGWCRCFGRTTGTRKRTNWFTSPGATRVAMVDDPAPTTIKGQIAAPVPLADGRLLAFYVHRARARARCG